MSYSASYLSSPSPDQPSTVFPDRLIRPLPKRTLKSRLSQEAAETIEYPPSLPSSNLPNYAQYGEGGEYLSDSKVLVHNGESYEDHDHYHEHDEDHCPHHHHHHCHHDELDEDVDSADDTSPVALRNAGSYRSPPRSPRTSRHTRYGSHGGRESISGPDGYEAFENTNNKKKRKIPTSGSLSLHHSSLTNELAQLGISPNQDGAVDDHASQAVPGSSGLGVQGAGRGHYARKSAARRPLGVSVNGSNLRNGTAKYDQNMAATAKEDSKDQGIISAAIANATALLRKPLGKGQENVGVLDQQSRQAAANSQFTFTCESDAKGVTFPEQSLYSSSYAQRSGYLPPPGGSQGGQRAGHPQTSQTNPNNTTQNAQQEASAQANANAGAAGKKPRRRRGDVYALAARQRKLQQEYANIQHKPAPEDIWMCEFCEYESIFGQPPQALIRQYEIKDRKERRRLAEKKRLLDKARRRSKKTAKSTKNSKNANSNRATGQQQDYDTQPLDQLGDDDLDYPYDEDPEPINAAPPAPAKEPVAPAHDAAGKGGGTGDGGGIR